MSRSLVGGPGVWVGMLCHHDQKWWRRSGFVDDRVPLVYFRSGACLRKEI